LVISLGRILRKLNPLWVMLLVIYRINLIPPQQNLIKFMELSHREPKEKLMIELILLTMLGIKY